MQRRWLTTATETINFPSEKNSKMLGIEAEQLVPEVIMFPLCHAAPLDK